MIKAILASQQHNKYLLFVLKHQRKNIEKPNNNNTFGNTFVLFGI